MKRLLLFILLLPAGAALFAQSAPDSESFRRKFWDQITMTCSRPVQWEKSVEELDEGDGTSKQSKVFLVDCLKGTARETATGEEKVLSTSEFADLFEYRYDDPYQSDLMEVERKNGGIAATPKTGKEGKTQLKRQVFEVDGRSGFLRFAEVKVVKTNLLYDFELHIRVWFDEDGLYLRHTTETFTRVVMSGSVRTVIEGKRLS